MIYIRLRYREALSELSNHKGIHPLSDTISFAQDCLLKLTIRFAPLLHQQPILTKFIH
jgi:hypothetical protein